MQTEQSTNGEAAKTEEAAESVFGPENSAETPATPTPADARARLQAECLGLLQERRERAQRPVTLEAALGVAERLRNDLRFGRMEAEVRADDLAASPPTRGGVGSQRAARAQFTGGIERLGADYRKLEDGIATINANDEWTERGRSRRREALRERFEAERAAPDYPTNAAATGAFDTLDARAAALRSVFEEQAEMPDPAMAALNSSVAQLRSQLALGEAENENDVAVVATSLLDSGLHQSDVLSAGMGGLGTKPHLLQALLEVVRMRAADQDLNALLASPEKLRAAIEIRLINELREEFQTQLHFVQAHPDSSDLAAVHVRKAS